jgi:hypothetical protein
MLDILKAHWTPVLVGFLALWAAVATWANRSWWPKPAVPPKPQWQMVLHVIVIDWPAAMPAVDWKGIFGLPFNIPYLSISVRPSTTPGEPPKSPTVPPIATWLVLALASLSVLGCGPAWQQRWENVGVDAAKCVANDAVGAAVSLLATLLGAAGNAQPDWGTVGETLGEKYGAQAAGCAIEKAVTDLSGGGLKVSRHDAALRYLHQHPEHVIAGARRFNKGVSK